MIPRTKRYIQYLAENNDRVMIPTPVVAEYLSGLPPEEHDRHLEILERNFFLPPFDVASAQLAARLLCDSAESKAIRIKHGIDKQSLRTDAMIIAIAKTHNANKIVTHDARHFRSLAKGIIVIEDIPQIQDQPELFGE